MRRPSDDRLALSRFDETLRRPSIATWLSPSRPARFEEAWIGEHHSAGFEIASPELFIAAAARARADGSGPRVSLPYHNPLMVTNRIISSTTRAGA